MNGSAASGQGCAGHRRRPWAQPSIVRGSTQAGALVVVTAVREIEEIERDASEAPKGGVAALLADVAFPNLGRSDGTIEFATPNGTGLNNSGRASVEASENKVPSAAGWLGGLGAAPFIGLAGVIPFLHGAPRMLVAHALVAYGATILSFLGGIHWGLAIGSQSSGDNRKFLARLVLSIMPSLVGWAALLVPETIGLLILAAAIAAMLWVDLLATRAGYVPSWYPQLRIPLTCVVVATLLCGAIAQMTQLSETSSGQIERSTPSRV